MSRIRFCTICSKRLEAQDKGGPSRFPKRLHAVKSLLLSKGPSAVSRTNLSTFSNNGLKCRSGNPGYGFGGRIFRNFGTPRLKINNKTGPFLHQYKCFHTSPRLNAPPAILVLILGRIAKLGAMLFGRTVRRWWQKLPPEEKAAYTGKVRRNRYILSGLLIKCFFLLKLTKILLLFDCSRLS